MNIQKTKERINRRSFLYSAAGVGAGLVFSPIASGQKRRVKKPDDINVALLGAGEQGRVLMNNCLKIPGIRFKAVCDIWTAYNQRRASGLLKKYRHENNAYVDYKEMLDKEKDLDAVIIATPDFWHADHTVDCLKAGLHVYCEKEMSNTLDGARKMVQAARQTGKLLQIGHQRRSNPRYIFCYEKLLKEAKLLGQITAVNGQWNRALRGLRGWPKKCPIEQSTLEKYGYKSIQQFRNWRWYKGLGGGPIVDLGSHQIDIYDWFLDAHPQSVMASGRTNYYDKKTHEWYDTVMAVYEYQTSQGPVTAFYQTISTNSSNGYFETFMGTEGTLVISEPQYRCGLYREGWITETKWDKWVKNSYLKKVEGLDQPEREDSLGDIRPPSPKPAKYNILDTMGNKRYHQPHLENFFDAVRGKAKLNCPAEVGYETAVAVLKVNAAAEAGRKLNFNPAEFKAWQNPA
jgi:predicted dehydrogenase